MHKFTLTCVTAIAIAAATVTPAQARTSCNDTAYLHAAIKSTKRQTVALKLARNERYGAAVTPARQALAIIKRSANPCDSNFYLQRRYEIHLAIAIQRWTETSRDGDYDRADLYWEDVKFWSNEINDLMLEK